MAPTTTTDSRSGSPTCVARGAPDVAVSFSHVHLYVDAIDDIDTYKNLESQLTEFSSKSINGGDEYQKQTCLDVEKCRELWNSIVRVSTKDSRDSDSGTSNAEAEFVPQNRDVVKQLIAGLGFRVTGKRMAGDGGIESNTRTVLVTSCDPKGVQVVVTALDASSSGTGVTKDKYAHFDAGNLKRFYKAHSNRQGIAVLAFTTSSIDTIYSRYQDLHPKLVTPQSMQIYENGTKVLEVYAYYQGEIRKSDADIGTVLRFVEKDTSCTSDDTMPCLLPGLEPVEAIFDPNAQAAYCDHWVSNVVSRTGFLDTLEETLGFTPKVDFNAGVVAAGEAQIESTVTGNDSLLATTETEVALRDQSQVYLPINNALSDVGHVHGFLKEIGQGIQHVASRVKDLPTFVQRGNDYRRITGEGFTFLNIPRSYYGVLMAKHFVNGIPNVGEGHGPDEEVLSPDCAHAVFEICEKYGIMSSDGAVDLDATRHGILSVLDGKIPARHKQEYDSKKDKVADVILHSRYSNLFSLLRHHLSEESYLKIVRNQILVDVQGEDLLFQIFTSNILQRNVGEEAPFFEFIQRVCSECRETNGCPVAIKPGCGGFGIRNFLTLFLSIEVSKAMLEVSQAKAAGDVDRQTFAQGMVGTFTDQLNESNPILTAISDAMTVEGSLKTQLNRAMAENDDDTVCILRNKLEKASEAKRVGNSKLMECSKKYKERMKALRENS
mmetsp:Transcript_29862/g.66159  ORF Transcript_29862/g.66159 Transcript_29862/m.66159 type:complete len:718 (+) Transcript_29862:75-2228(+)